MYERLIHLEAHEIGSEPDEEREELAELYARKGIPRDVAQTIASELMKDPEIALQTHAREELGLDPDEGLGSPVAAAASSFVSFAFGAFVPLLPFLISEGSGAVVASAVLSGIALFAVGATISYLTGKSWLLSGLRMLLVGAAAASITFLVGTLLDDQRPWLASPSPDAAARSATTSWSAAATRPAGIDASPASRRGSIAALSSPAISHRTVRARSRTG